MPACSSSPQFSFAAPPNPPTSPFASLLSPLHHVSIYSQLLNYSNTLLKARTDQAVKKEMATLAGNLRDEYKMRVGGIKADWMARWIPEEAENEAEDDSDPVNMVPTITSDVDEMSAMSARVDAAVEREFATKIQEAKERVRVAVQRNELMECELFIGAALMNAQNLFEDEHEIAQIVQEALQNALEAIGTNVSQ